MAVFVILQGDNKEGEESNEEVKQYLGEENSPSLHFTVHHPQETFDSVI